MNKTSECGAYVLALLLLGAVGPWWLNIACVALIVIAYM